MRETVNVIKLHQPPPSRIKRIREWHASQVDQEHVALVSIAITADNTIKSTGLAIEPSHAAALLPELVKVIGQLAIMAAAHTPRYG